MKKIYYKLSMIQSSPLRIGNGNSEDTDSDLMTDSRDLPFIPGSSLAGVLREQLLLCCGSEDGEEKAQKLFGNVTVSRENDKAASMESRILISDAVLPPDADPDNVKITRRDGVGLDEWGTAVPGAKFDFEVAETELPYTAVIEWSGDEAQEKDEVETILEPLMKRAAAGLTFGARTTRGYGKMQVSVLKKEFCFPEDLEKWLLFDAFQEIAFSDGKELSAGHGSEETVVTVSLKMKGSFAVNVRTTTSDPEPDGTIPDVVPMMSRKEFPVIPGTSISGAFRHHMHDILRESGIQGITASDIDYLYGVDQSKNEHSRSKLRFSEMEVMGGGACTVTRNAVDRFTAAPRNKGLYTVKLWHGGDGSFSIRFYRDTVSKNLLQLLAACITDLHYGLLTFGGGSGVGRGCAAVTKIMVNETDVTDRLQKCDMDMLEVL